jgi:hypothetical protein
VPYEDLNQVRKKLSERLRSDIKDMPKSHADRMAEQSVRRSAEQIERQVKRGERSGT